MTDKLIVSNKAALRRKYGGAGLARIRTALDRLVAADRKRGHEVRCDGVLLEHTLLAERVEIIG